ncbi:MAG: plasmid stabilization protein [Flavobacteriaceae bacterium]|nr:MAG: plasmid stabilization protein [Flavobacteriaceae bacterium]
MATYRLSPDAEDDLYRIWLYGVRKFGVPQADKYYEAFFLQFDLIAKDPLLFQSVDYIKKGYRRGVSGSESIYYRIDGNNVEIMAIVGRQDVNIKL